MTQRLGLTYTSAHDGKKLQELHPEIAEDARGGMTYWDIAQKYDVPRLFKVTRKNSCEIIVHRALAGCPYTFTTARGTVRLESYEGLIPSEERENLTKAHMKANGDRHKKNGWGIFGLDEETRRKNASYAGRIGGAKGGRSGHLARGHVLWEDVEILAYALMTRDPAYHAEGDLNKRLNRTKIAKKGNELFHRGNPVRDATSIGSALYRERTYIAQFLSFLEESCA